jgi:hypothetical protein
MSAVTDLRAQARHYRHLASMITDPRTHAILLEMASEEDAKAVAAEAHETLKSNSAAAAIDRRRT